MKFVLLMAMALLSVSTYPSNKMKTQMSSMHGERFGVEYTVLNTGEHVFNVKEKVGMENGKSLFRNLKSINLSLKKNEVFSYGHSFHCYDKEKQYVYAIFDKKKAKEGTKLKPDRGWRINQRTSRVEKLRNINSVSCQWSQNGDEPFPFPSNKSGVKK